MHEDEPIGSYNMVSIDNELIDTVKLFFGIKVLTECLCSYRTTRLVQWRGENSQIIEYILAQK